MPVTGLAEGFGVNQRPSAMLPRMSTVFATEAQSGFRCVQFWPQGAAERTPAIVFLHGSGERGSDSSLVLRYGLPAMLNEGRALANCAVYCPQLEPDREWQPEEVAKLIDSLHSCHTLLVLIGFSLGAKGICNFTAAYGAKVSCAIAIAGQGPHAVSSSQEGTRFLAIHGELDTWADTAAFVSAVQAARGEARLIEIPGEGHFISEIALCHPEVVRLLAHHGIHISARNAG